LKKSIGAAFGGHVLHRISRWKTSKPVDDGEKIRHAFRRGERSNYVDVEMFESSGWIVERLKRRPVMLCDFTLLAVMTMADKMSSVC
jgi:hypothetical protein